MDEQPSAFIHQRRSIRAYTGAPVSDSHVRALLEAAMAAPSAVAKDPWRFVVVRAPARLESLARELSNGALLPDAGLGIVVCGDLDAAHDGQLSYLLQDCSAAIENLLLAASALGLGACWLGIHPREARIRFFKHALALPGNVIPVACIAVGHPAEQKEPRTRYREEHVRRETWRGPAPT